MSTDLASSEAATTPQLIAFVALMLVVVLAGCLLVPQYKERARAAALVRGLRAWVRTMSAPPHVPLRSPSSHRDPRPVSGRHAADPTHASPRVGSAVPTPHRRHAA